MAHAGDESEMAAGIPSSRRNEGGHGDAGAKQFLGAVSRQLLAQCALFRVQTH